MLKSIHICLLIFLFLPILTFRAQLRIQSRLSVKLDIVKCSKYVLEKELDPNFKTILIPVEFAEFELEDNKDAEVLKNAVVKSIDLVYTQYPEDFDFTELNRRRIEYLHLICPTAFDNPLTNWRLVAQTAGKTEAQARKLFHGFAITYRPAPTDESLAVERDYLAKTFKNPHSIGDSTVLKIFKRNNWKNMTVVSDFTGSMSPYISQVFLWYNLTFTTKAFSEFVFFNDGNNTPDASKKMGRTGGIYYCNSLNRDTVIQTAMKCSRSGGGGDAQENNIEAALFAVKQNPKIKEIIMIVDNWAPMRDFAMIDKLEIPVHVLVCGAHSTYPVNPQYIELARATKGSLHTIEEDILDLAKLAEGKRIKIHGFEYIMTGGILVPVKKI